MSGISITLETDELQRFIKRLKPLFDFDGTELMTAIAALGDSQTRRRVTDEKTSPDGTPWKPNHAGTPILMATGQHLLSSLAWAASSDEAEWGATWEYAHVHQDGMTIVPKNGEHLVFQLGDRTVFAKEVTIPARPFAGMSTENEREMVDLVTDHFGSLLQ